MLPAFILVGLAMQADEFRPEEEIRAALAVLRQIQAKPWLAEELAPDLERAVAAVERALLLIETEDVTAT